MNSKFTLKQFNARYPNDYACLEEIKQLRFGNELECPKCHKTNKFYKLDGRMAYSCAFCRYQIYPLNGTIFQKTTTPLTDWFYAIYLMAQTRAGISAKQLERELGVTYKTAWRMFHQIRKLMGDDDNLLSGEVEIDEAYFHPNPQRRSTAKSHNSEVVLGMVQRKGKAKVRHVKSAGVRVVLPVVEDNIDRETQIYTDEHGSYRALSKKGYAHATINHQVNRYVRGDIHTQNVENLWSNMKRGIRGVYRHVSPQHLQAYVNEYAFRYSYRDSDVPMFYLILREVV